MPSQFLLVRDLPPETTPQQIVTSIIKLDVQIRRLLLVEGREGEHVPIAFIELQDSNAAGRVLALAAGLPGKGFSVNRKPVHLSFIHPGVFVPVYGETGPGIFKATNSAQLLEYWNQDYRCSIFTPEDAIPEDSMEEEKKPKEESKKRKALGGGVTIKSGSGGMIGHWSKRQDELNGVKPVDSPAATSFADLKIMACLLCSRKFKTEADLQAHEAQSDLHRDNLANPALLAKAQDRLRARQPVEPPPSETGFEYRDRALERRAQIKASGGSIEVPPARKKQRTRDSPEAAAEETQPKGPSKGEQLLARMGYVSGGLGAQNQGRADIVHADQYVPGVGLGAGGKLTDAEAKARREGSSYKDFVESVKESARARYEREF